MQQLQGSFVIVRTRDAGVHAGNLLSVDGDTVMLSDARRLWRWWAAKSISLSGVALHGLSSRNDNRIGGVLSHMAIRGWCEILPCSAAAAKSITDCKEADAKH